MTSSSPLPHTTWQASPPSLPITRGVGGASTSSTRSRGADPPEEMTPSIYSLQQQRVFEEQQSHRYTTDRRIGGVGGHYDTDEEEDIDTDDDDHVLEDVDTMSDHHHPNRFRNNDDGNQLPDVEEVKAGSSYRRSMPKKKRGKGESAEYNGFVRMMLGLGCLIVLASISLTIGIVAGRNAKEAAEAREEQQRASELALQMEQEAKEKEAAYQQAQQETAEQNAESGIPNPEDEVEIDPADMDRTDNTDLDEGSGDYSDGANPPSFMGSDAFDPSNNDTVPSNNDTTTGGVSTRFKVMRESVVDWEWTDNTTVYDPNTPQYRAIDWISNLDQINYTIDMDEKFAERYAMVVFYFSMNLDVLSYLTDDQEDIAKRVGWTYNAQFLSGTLDICDWHQPLLSRNSSSSTSVEVGVKCADQVYVSELYLPSNNMNGTIPSEIKLLRRLEDLDLFNNRIYGVIPETMVANTKLTAIQLHSNSFETVLPTFLHQLPNLKVINLSVNNFAGTIPSTFGNISTLEALDLKSNGLTGKSLRALKGLSKLKSLQLGDNYISGALDDDVLSTWTSLEVMDINNNLLEGPLPQSLFTNEQLRIVDLHENSFGGELPDRITTKSNIIFLALHDNDLIGEIDERITTLHKLEHLDLSTNGFTGTLPDEIGNLGRLKYLFVAFNEGLTLQTIPTTIGKLTDLRDVSFQQTNRFGTIPTEIQYLRNLTLLDLNDNDMSGSIPDAIGAVRNLQFLTLKGNSKLEGSIPADMMLLEHLDTLVLYGTGITSGAAALCDDITGISTLKEFVADCEVLTDCKNNCCTDCCDGTQQDCPNTVWYSSIDPMELYGYTRQNYCFHDNDKIDPDQFQTYAAQDDPIVSAIPIEQQENIDLWNQYGFVQNNNISNHYYGGDSP